MLAWQQASISLFLKEAQQKRICVIIIAVHVADSSAALERVSAVPRAAESLFPKF